MPDTDSGAGFDRADLSLDVAPQRWVVRERYARPGNRAHDDDRAVPEWKGDRDPNECVDPATVTGRETVDRIEERN